MNIKFSIHPLRRSNGLLVLLLAMLLLIGCTAKKSVRDVERSFYYWKSSFNLTEPEQKTVKELRIKLLYIKFFDVAWSADKKEAMPMAIIKFPKKPDSMIAAVIPAVFITNECMLNLPDNQVGPTAQKIVLLIENIARTYGIANIPEIQIDCDWNASTKEKYFLLLQTIKDQLAGKKILSATIRLHQYKYFRKLGTPPADRGLLMCYNMGNLQSFYTRNSILETGELEKYLSAAPDYLLPLDVALPLFSWKVLFRNKNYAGLIRELPASYLNDNRSIKRSGNNYEMLQSTSLDGYSFQQGDILRDEAISYDELIEAADMVSAKLKSQRARVVLYHLDSITLSKFSIHELETIFNHLR